MHIGSPLNWFLLLSEPLVHKAALLAQTFPIKRVLTQIKKQTNNFCSGREGVMEVELALLVYKLENSSFRTKSMKQLYSDIGTIGSEECALGDEGNK